MQTPSTTAYSWYLDPAILRWIDPKVTTVIMVPTISLGEDGKTVRVFSSKRQFNEACQQDPKIHRISGKELHALAEASRIGASPENILNIVQVFRKIYTEFSIQEVPLDLGDTINKLTLEAVQKAVMPEKTFDWMSVDLFKIRRDLVKWRDSEGNNIIHWALESGRIDYLRAVLLTDLLPYPKIFSVEVTLLFKANSKGVSPIQLALKLGNGELIDELFKHYISIMQKLDRKAYHGKCLSDPRVLLQILPLPLKEMAACDKQGNTLLHRALLSENSGYKLNFKFRKFYSSRYPIFIAPFFSK